MICIKARCIKASWILVASVLGFAAQSQAKGFSDPSLYKAGELIVVLNPHASFAASALRDNAEYKIERLDKGHKMLAGGNFVVRYTHPWVGRDLAQRAAKLQAEAGASYVEPNYFYHLLATPNDPRFGELYGLRNEGQTGGKKGADIKAADAWEQGTGSHKILVGITDTGIDYNHPDLKANIYHNPGESGLDENGVDKSKNGIDDDGNGYVDDFRGWDFINKDNDPMDDHGHGTHCAGTIGASGDDGVGIAGVNWNVSLISMKIFDRRGSTTVDAIVEAIRYNSLIKVNVSSNSWGGGPFSQAVYDAIKDNQANNVLFVAAAGNSSQNTDTTPNYPSALDLDNIVAVAATDHNDALAYFSSYGKKTVDVAAPGVNILSCAPGGGYQKMSGTSMATPHVSGVAALVWSMLEEGTSYKAVATRVIAGADRISTVAGKVATGRVNIVTSLEDDEEAPGKISAAEIFTLGTTDLKVRFSGTGDDGSKGQAFAYEVRWAKTPVASLEDWQAATSVNAEVLAVSDANVVELLVTGFAAGTEGYLAIRAVDNVGQSGEVSEALSFATINNPTPE